jgi:hypothetical protein
VTSMVNTPESTIRLCGYVADWLCPVRNNITGTRPDSAITKIPFSSEDHELSAHLHHFVCVFTIALKNARSVCHAASVTGPRSGRLHFLFTRC